MVAQFREVHVVVETGPDGGDHGPDGVVAEHLVSPGLLHVEDLAPERQDGLRATVSAHLGSASSGVALYEVELAELRVLLRTVCQFAGQSAAVHGVLADDEVARLAGGLAGSLRGQALVQDALGVHGIVFEVVLNGLGQHRLHLCPHLWVSEFAFGLAFELRVGQFDADHSRQSFARLFTRKVGFVVFDQLLLSPEVVEDSGHGRPESGDVRAAVDGVDAVGEGVDELGEAVVVLKGGLDDSPIELLLHVDRFFVNDLSRLIEILDEAGDAAVEIVGHLVVGPECVVIVTLESNLEAFVEVCHLLETLGQDVEVESGVFEDIGVEHECCRGSRIAVGFCRRLPVLKLRQPLAAGELLVVNPAAPRDLD